MAGWLGGSAGIVVGHPADTVKVVQQVFHDNRKYAGFKYCAKRFSLDPEPCQVYNRHMIFQGFLFYAVPKKSRQGASEESCQQLKISGGLRASGGASSRGCFTQ